MRPAGPPLSGEAYAFQRPVFPAAFLYATLDAGPHKTDIGRRDRARNGTNIMASSPKKKTAGGTTPSVNPRLSSRSGQVAQADGAFGLFRPRMYSCANWCQMPPTPSTSCATSHCHDIPARIRAQPDDHHHPDKAAKTLTISDNGIGMTAAELASNLGTIARSGTEAFLANAKDGHRDRPVRRGIYAAFMVADKVDVDIAARRRNRKPSLEFRRSRHLHREPKWPPPRAAHGSCCT